MFRSMGGAAFGSLFKATNFTTQTENTTLTVPDGANAIHIQAAVGGGASGVNGFAYDKSGGESGGTGGGSAAYISDKVFSVSQGETLTLTVGAGGTGNTGGTPNQQGVDGENTVLSGSSTGSIFTLGAGEAGGSTGGSSPLTEAFVPIFLPLEALQQSTEQHLLQVLLLKPMEQLSLLLPLLL
jgi:hypothetical protein